MSAALTAPFLVAALLLCVAGTLKLRSPKTAAVAPRTRTRTLSGKCRASGSVMEFVLIFIDQFDQAAVARAALQTFPT